MNKTLQLQEEIQATQDNALDETLSDNEDGDGDDANLVDFSAEELPLEAASPSAKIPEGEPTCTEASPVWNQDFGPALFYAVKVQETTASSAAIDDTTQEDASSGSDDDCSTGSLNSSPSKKKKPATKKVPLHYPIHWWHRGEDLKKLTQYEYHCLVDVLPYSSVGSKSTGHTAIMDKEDISEGSRNTIGPRTGGQKKRKAFLFHPTHPLYKSHAQYLRAKQHTLISL